MSSEEICIEALRRSDERTMLRRAERMVAISRVIEGVSYCGVDEPIAMMRDAGASYINGCFVTSMISAMSSIEHMLLLELHDRGFTTHNKKNVDSMSKGISCMRDVTTGNEALLDTLDELNKLRNAYVHPQKENFHRRRTNRAKKAGTSVDEISQQDAFCAIEAMYQVFNLTLKNLSCAEWVKFVPT
ncbi:hypothetical protein [Pseudomonas sp. HLS-6]|uniref:hypothetical protein n=1 Tax=Pseudomonas sp. HLS-6 TaxID=2049589 RepID=UPI0012FDD337|nr:hypothetical protein [Pseudomonas sp. HLS-6]